MTSAVRTLLWLFAALPVVHGFVAGVVPRGSTSPAMGLRAAVARPSNGHLAAQRQRTVASPQMGLFGLGTPEIAIIAVVGLLVLGPDQVKKLAKDVGKVSAELKQVPEEFNKGMEVGQQELEAKKTTAPAAESPVVTPSTPSDDATK